MNKPFRILLAAHDAGGAAILAALMKKYQDQYTWFPYTCGPATDIFRRQGLRPRTVKAQDKGEIIDILQSKKLDLVLTGTGWGSRMEFDFIQKAKDLQIKSTAFLDHWCNYRERFGYPGPWQPHLPDYIFVGDSWGYQRAIKDHFPKERVLKVENPYWQAVAESIERDTGKRAKPRTSPKVKLLFLSSPMAPHAKRQYGDERYWGFTEYDNVDDFLDMVKDDPRLELSIRLHPAEPKDKYAYLKAKDVRITDNQKNDLIKDCCDADIIIGCDTMALVTAWMMGRRAISYIPGNKLKATLPQQGIVRVRSMQALKRHIHLFKKKDKVQYQLKSFFTQAFPKVLLNLN